MDQTFSSMTREKTELLCLIQDYNQFEFKKKEIKKTILKSGEYRRR